MHKNQSLLLCLLCDYPCLNDGETGDFDGKGQVDEKDDARDDGKASKGHGSRVVV